jgi:hypothetical protein
MKTEIISMCGMPEQRYHETIFRSGIDYLKHETSGDEFYVSEIARSGDFWQWWNDVVSERNKLFIKEFAIASISKHELYLVWESLLSVKSLNVYPPTHIWSAGYEDLVQNLIRKDNAII